MGDSTPVARLNARMRRNRQARGFKSSRARAARGLAIAALLVLALGGCSGPSAEDAMPLGSGAPLRTSGPLADGFKIEPGSALIGPVFPYGDGGLRVILAVDGEMQRIFEGYVRQAEALGFPVDAPIGRPGGEWCSNAPDSWIFHGDDERFEVECAAYGSVPNQWQMALRGFTEHNGQGYIEIAGGRQLVGTSSMPSVPDGPEAAVTDVRLAPDLAPVEDDPAIRVVDGSRVLFDPLPSDCSTGGYVAMLQVTAELAPVMRGYQKQFTDARFQDGLMGIVGDEDEFFIDTTNAGGSYLGAVGVVGQPSYVLITRCNG